MATAADNLAYNLAHNLTAMRGRGQLSQAQLAKIAGIPRSTITHMESGAGNPSLANLARVAGALQINIEDLLARPRNAISWTAADRVMVTEGVGVKVYKLVAERLGAVEIERLELRPGATKPGAAHRKGTKEYLYVLKGALTLLVAGQTQRVAAGELLTFPADQTHSYHNSERAIADALTVVVPVPPG